MNAPVKGLKGSGYVRERAIALLKNMQFRELFARIFARVYWRSTSVGLFFGLAAPVEILPAGVPITIRPLRTTDAALILNVREPGLSPQDRHDINVRLMMLTTGISGCHVGLDSSGVPRYLQWLVGPEENDRLQEAFHGWLPRLSAEEMLVENLYVDPSFRGKKIMQYGVTTLLALARERGAARVITFIPRRNSLALELHLRLGFRPYAIRTSATRFFRTSVTFTPIGQEDDALTSVRRRSSRGAQQAP
jgi:GNAT superfamily N-acetyltransferase